MSIDTQQYLMNEAWVLFQLNDKPIETELDGDLNVFAIMDVASRLAFGMEFVSVLAEEPSEFEAKKLLDSSELQAGARPKYLFMDSSKKLDQFARVVTLQGIKLVLEESRNLDLITEEIRTGFAIRVSRGTRQ